MKSPIPDNNLPSLNCLDSKCPISFPRLVHETYKNFEKIKFKFFNIFGKLKNHLLVVLGGQIKML